MDQTSSYALAPQLLRKSYTCSATHEEREYFLYLPARYDADPDRQWPVMLFLHGGGERGDGRADLDWVLHNGPLGEAWIYKHDLPFIIIAPQLPVFDRADQIEMRAGKPLPMRLAQGVPPRQAIERPDFAMIRGDSGRPPKYGSLDSWGIEGAPGGWQNCDADLLAMVDATLSAYRADPKRVYLTGLSYGGYGTWYMATAHPQRWAAIVPICGGGNPALAHRLAEVQMPVWIFHGGRDEVVLPRYSYEMANALEEAGHESVRLTIHEDLPHNCWDRVYSGEDVYTWLLQYRLDVAHP